MTVVLIISNADSTLGCKLLADALRSMGQACITVGNLKETRLQAHPPSDLEVDLPIGPMEFLNTPFLQDATAIGLFVSTTELDQFARVYRQHCRLHNCRPAPLFTGSTFPLVGDALVADLMARQTADLVMVHGPRQLQEAQAMTFQWSESFPALVEVGFWFMPECPRIGRLHNPGPPEPPHTLLVIGQDSVPSSDTMKLDLFRRLWTWARENEESEQSCSWTVKIAMDHRRVDPTSWTKDKRTKSTKKPRNLSFAAQEALLDLIAQSSICLSFSSPWLFTAAAWGKPIIAIGDYGFRQELSSPLLLGAGCMHELGEITALDDLLTLPQANPHWLRTMGWSVHDGPKRLLQALHRLQEARS